MYRSIFIWICITFIPFLGEANHIIGGQIFYEPLSFGRVRVTIEIYRDGTDPDGANFDNPLGVTIVGNNNERDVVFFGSPSISPLNFNSIECKDQAGSTGYQKGVYTQILSLFAIVPPDPDFGWKIIHRRCCFNSAARNIQNPSDVGFSLDLTIPNDFRSNSSPYFTDDPQLRACVFEENRVDASAFDPDGDSLVYSLCAPLFAEQRHAFPYAESRPPYGQNTVTYLPNYSAIKPLETLRPIEINSQTGEIIFTPTDALGNYLFGICVDEYRNGQLLGSYQRTYQVQLQDCVDRVKAEGKITNTSVPCPMDQVNFSGQGVDGVPPYSYSWDFNTPNPEDRSNSKTPVFTYSEPGNYLVELTITDNVNCKTTETISVFVGEELSISFEADNAICKGEEIEVRAITSIDSSKVFYNWSSDGQSLNTQAVRNILNYIPNSNETEITIDVSASSTFACNNPYSNQFTFQLKQPLEGKINQDTFRICNGESIQAIAESSLQNSDFTWKVNGGFFQNTQSIEYFPSDSLELLTVEISNPNACNSVFDTVPILIEPSLTVGISGDTFYCSSDSIFLTPNISIGSRANWKINNSELLSQNIDTVLSAGDYTIVLTAIDSNVLCVTNTSDSIILQVRDFYNAELQVDTLNANCDSLYLLCYNSSINTDENEWNQSTNSDSFLFNIPSGSAQTITLIATDFESCNLQDTIQQAIGYFPKELIAESPDFNLLEDYCDSALFEFISFDSTLGRTTFWQFNDSIRENDSGQIILTEDIVDILYVLTDSSTCNISDSIAFSKHLDRPKVNVQLKVDSFNSVFCAEIVEIIFEISNSNAVGTQFLLNDQLVSTDSLFTYVSPDKGVLNIEVIGSNPSLKCFNADTINSQLEIPDFLIIDELESVIGCKLDSISIPINGNLNGIQYSLDNQPVRFDSIIRIDSKEAGNFKFPIQISTSTACNTIVDTIQYSIGGDFIPIEIVSSTQDPIIPTEEISFFTNPIEIVNWFMNGEFLIEDSEISLFPELNMTTLLCVEQIDDLKCSLKTCKQFDIVVLNDFDFPNAFSPDGDNINDIFRCTSNKFTNFRLVVYNKFGYKLFETRNPLEGWDGTINGEIAPEGVYLYKAFITTLDNQTVSETGNVTLIR